MGQHHIAALTSIRIFAAVLVVIYHYGRGVWPFAEGWLHRVTACAGSSVAFFFFLSGYILAHAYRDHPWREPAALRSYYTARLARIYPIYLLALVAMVALESGGLYWDRVAALKVASALLVHAGLLQAWLPDYVFHWNVPGWSLSVEASFYLVFPLLALRVQRLRRPVALALFGVLYVVSQAILGAGRGLVWNDWFFQDPMVHHLLMYHPLVYWPVFGMGMLTYRICRTPDIGQGQLPAAAMGALSAGAMLLIVAFSYAAGPILNYSIHVGLLAPVYGMLVYSLADSRNWLARLLSVRWLHFLGEASYGVYILQLPVYGLWLCTGVVPAESATGFFVYLVSLLAIAAISFQWYETPLRRWLRRRLARA